MRGIRALFGLLVIAGVAGAQTDTARLSKGDFLDKCKGAWAGQMAGVCFGAPTEFTTVGRPITEPLPEWTPDLIKGAIGQDDCYVEMTFLKALEENGLDITNEQAGKAFAATEYPLWHANLYGRENVRRGIMPPASGRPENNRHADDIDFQIESDLFGIICPGLPQESNRLCDIFGHIMNYGDGVYGGMFMAGMYAAAYFEDDVRRVVEAGLKCIPDDSQYAQCIRFVIEWHDAQPDNWLATWRKIEGKWQDNVDCMPKEDFNIDAKLNGAYVAMGLLYGDGDMGKTIEIATRCGQDSDCNPSNAAGVLGCMLGYDAIDPMWTSGIAAIADQKFIHTDYSFNTLITACQGVAEKVIQRAGGTIEADGYVIPRQLPKAAALEQWADQQAILMTPITASEMARWSPDWHVAACGLDMEPGVRPNEKGRDNVLVLHPVSETEPAAIEADLAIPATAKTLAFSVASHTDGNFLLRVLINEKLIKEQLIDSKGRWMPLEFDVAPYAGQTAHVRIEDVANNWYCELAYLTVPEIR